MVEPVADVLRERLVGRSIVQFSLSDWWGVGFDDGLWLVAQGIASKDEAPLNALLATSEPPVLDGVDPAFVAQAALLCRNIRRDVESISLESDGTLELTFEGGRSLRFPTTTAIVDWQWCLSRSGRDPYAAPFVAACLARGTIELGNGL